MLFLCILCLPPVLLQILIQCLPQDPVDGVPVRGGGSPYAICVVSAHLTARAILPRPPCLVPSSPVRPVAKTR